MRNLLADNDSQASVIGTIMAIMVVLAFLAFVTEQYIPAAMLENEAYHMDEVEAQLGWFKQTVDNQILKEDTVMTMYSPVMLGSDNIAVFSVPSAGELAFDSNESTSQVSVSFKVADEDDWINETSRGKMRFFAGNRYYIPQSIIYENGALIIAQRQGNVMLASPHISIINKSDSLEINCMLLTLIGESSTVSGIGTTGITSHLSFTDTWEFQDITSDFFINVTTRYPQAWSNFFNRTASDADLDNSEYSWDRTYTGQIDTVYFVIKNQNSKISSITLQRAAVDISIGTKENIKT